MILKQKPKNLTFEKLWMMLIFSLYSASFLQVTASEMNTSIWNILENILFSFFQAVKVAGCLVISLGEAKKTKCTICIPVSSSESLRMRKSYRTKTVLQKSWKKWWIIRIYYINMCFRIEIKIELKAYELSM